MQPEFDHCTALVREGDRDRYLATLFAPAEHRGALFALYAFNVEISRPFTYVFLDPSCLSCLCLCCCPLGLKP